MANALAPERHEAAALSPRSNTDRPSLARIHGRIRRGHYDRPEVLEAAINAVIAQALNDR